MRRLSTALLTLALAVLPAAAAPPAAQPGEPTIPQGSADYSKMLAQAVAYKKGRISFEQLKRYVVAAKLPPHPSRCGYLIMPVPAPPPPMPFEPGLMPSDWLHTFGEVTMTYWIGTLTREEYDRLHEAAHRTLPGYPNCIAGPR